MKLRKPCEEHGTHYDEQYFNVTATTSEWCPGGVFLPDDTETLLAEVSDAELQEEWIRRTTKRQESS